MFFKKKEKNEFIPLENRSLMGSVIGMGFDFLKSMVKDFEQTRQVKKIEQFHDQLSTLEHLVVKLDEHLAQTRKELSKLRQRLLAGWIVSFGLLVTIAIQVFS